MLTTPSRLPGALSVRVAFAVVILVLPLQLGVQWLWSEPYPALTQPAFAFSARPLTGTDSLPKTAGYVTVTFSDGSSREYSAGDLIGWTAGISPTTILLEPIIEREHAPAETAAWLTALIAATGESRRPVTALLRVESYVVDARSLTESSRTTTAELAIELSARQP